MQTKQQQLLLLLLLHRATKNLYLDPQQQQHQHQNQQQQQEQQEQALGAAAQEALPCPAWRRGHSAPTLQPIRCRPCSSTRSTAVVQELLIPHAPPYGV